MIPHVLPGRSFPLGSKVFPAGVNFSVYSQHSTAMELLLFDAVDDQQPARVIRLEASPKHRTFHYWHVFVRGLKAGQIYAWRAIGPFQPERGLRFDAQKTLLDPYGRCVAIPARYDRGAAARSGDNAATAMKSVVADLNAYDWEGDTPLRHPFSQTVIYEMHVGGFTKHPNSGVTAERRGTFLGLIEKIPYLRDLGVTAVELLPIYQFDPTEAPPGLTNFWGYNPVSFFAPHAGYAVSKQPLAVLDEFRDMVKALHRAGIEVILDVVYNHTAEGNELGPNFCFRGLANEAYYSLWKDKRYYVNYSGTGNSLDANHTIVRRLILDSLRFWVREMHVDGFRFDLASVLSRDSDGNPQPRPPILWDIETDPVLSGSKLIAEAWDAAGLYQVGSFFGDHWKEWNGKFRDDVRAFVKSDPGHAGKLASRFLASPDIYAHESREPQQSINFVTCHDGFTLNDLVTYNQKHNDANHEENRDGHNENLSWNCGAEGPTDNADIERLRTRQIKNFFAINLLALGVPMLLMGDEVRRTQRGNNNAYCQDNELGWFDWSLVQRHADIHRFVGRLIAFRRSLPLHSEDSQLSLSELLRRARLDWHGVRLHQPDWSDQSRTVAFTIYNHRDDFHVIFNAFWEPLSFELPPINGSRRGPWQRLIDTSLASPHDLPEIIAAPIVETPAYRAEARSVVVLVAIKSGG